jgi:hypothetical protein
MLQATAPLLSVVGCALGHLGAPASRRRESGVMEYWGVECWSVGERPSLAGGSEVEAA